jgi:hypothetical protein
MALFTRNAQRRSPFERYSRALDDWRRAARLVAERWEVYTRARSDSQPLAFAAYMAALDAEAVAADDLAGRSNRMAA